jgi:hypothetical protein
VDFRPRKTRDDSLAVEVERDRTVKIGAVGHHMGFSQPGKNFPARVTISITRSHGYHCESGMHPVEQQGDGGSRAAVMSHLEEIGFRLLLRDLLF